MCEFIEAWRGTCTRLSTEKYCRIHRGIECFFCGAQAVRDCAHTGYGVCCVPMCNDHIHHSDG